MTLDVNPNKEVKGVTIRTLIAIVVVIAGLIFSYSDIKSAVLTNREATNELKSVLTTQQQANEVQLRVLQNQLREQDLRLIKLETQINYLKP